MQFDKYTSIKMLKKFLKEFQEIMGKLSLYLESFSKTLKIF